LEYLEKPSDDLIKLTQYCGVPYFSILPNPLLVGKKKSEKYRQRVSNHFMKICIDLKGVTENKHLELYRQVLSNKLNWISFDATLIAGIKTVFDSLDSLSVFEGLDWIARWRKWSKEQLIEKAYKNVEKDPTGL